MHSYIMYQVLSTHWFVATLPKRLMCQRGQARWPFFRPRKASGSLSAQPFKPPFRHWAARRRPTPDTHILPWTLTQRAGGVLPFSVSLSVLNFTRGVGSFNWVLGYLFQAFCASVCSFPASLLSITWQGKVTTISRNPWGEKITMSEEESIWWPYCHCYWTYLFSPYYSSLWKRECVTFV